MSRINNLTDMVSALAFLDVPNMHACDAVVFRDFIAASWVVPNSLHLLNGQLVMCAILDCHVAHVVIIGT